MADLKVCDRCGKQMEPAAQDRYSIRVNSNEFGTQNPIIFLDLCQDCLNDFRKWSELKQLPKTPEPEMMLDSLFKRGKR